MPYNTPNVSCWCCTGTGFENHAKYGWFSYDLKTFQAQD